MTPTAGPRVARFIETFLTLGGSFLGQPFRLRPFQRDLLDDIYRLGPDGRRLRRTYVVGLPRKNAKSQLGAAIALYHLIADSSDAAPQVVSAAGDRKQARLVFDEARRMVLSSPELRAVCTVQRDVILCQRNGGTYRAVSADAGLQQGLNPSCVIFDELHVLKSPELYEALTLGSAARSQPITLVISTAGSDLDSPLGRLYSYGLRVSGHRLNGEAQPGELDDPSFGMTWYGPAPGLDYDPADEGLWEVWNPLWPVLNPEEFRASYRTTHESAFIRYRLNGWTATADAFLPHGAWAKLARPDLRIPDGAPVVLGFDGAWKGDSTGLVAVSLPDVLGLPHVELLGHWEAPPADPDWRTPIGEVRSTMEAALRRFRVRELAADPFHYHELLQELADAGHPVVEFPTNSVQRIVPATEGFYRAVMDGALSHDGSPALDRHLSNAVVRDDARGLRITKESSRSRRKIDLAVATIVGHTRALAVGDEPVRAEPRLIVL